MSKIEVECSALPKRPRKQYERINWFCGCVLNICIIMHMSYFAPIASTSNYSHTHKNRITGLFDILSESSSSANFDLLN